MVSPICILKVVAFLDLLAVGLIVPLVPIQVRRMGGNYIHVGLLGSIYAGFQLGSGPLIGSLSDLKGRKSVLIITLLICSVAYTVKGFANIYVMLIVRAVLGLFKQTQMLTRAMVADYEKNEQRQGVIYGKMMAISGVGMTLGPVFGGHIADDYPEFGFTFIAFCVGFCFIINAGLISLLPKPMTNEAKRIKSNIKQGNIVQMLTNSFKQSFIELYNIDWFVYGDIFMFKALVGFAMGVYFSIYASLLREQFNLTPKYISYLISFQSVVGSFSSYRIGYINTLYRHDKDYSLRNFHVFLLLSVALLGLTVSVNVYLYAFFLIPLAIGNSVGRLITLEMVLKRSHGSHRGKLIGASNSVRSFSGVISPIVAGVIGEYFGVVYVIYASLVSTSLGVILSYRHRYKRLKCD